MKKEKIIFKNYQSPGDIVMLTAAIRDLHQSYPGQYLTDVRTSCPDLWINNPYLTELKEDEKEVRVLNVKYPLIHKSNTHPYHFIHGFRKFINEELGLNIQSGFFKGDIHLTQEEKNKPCQVFTLMGNNTPYWIINAGGKLDFTTKWWSTKRYQDVVDNFKGKILFVQIGEKGHHHPKLNNTLDLRGKTTLRELVLLTYHSDGVLTPVSLPMHLAAAVEVKQCKPKNRACVVVAGGREPMHWEAYPHHQFLHTNGALLCCDKGGCWKTRVKPLNDNSEFDNPKRICVDVVKDLPKCMDMISPGDVIRRIELYYEGKALKYLDEEIKVQKSIANRTAVLSLANANYYSAKYIEQIPHHPSKLYKGKGIVICGGGKKYFTCAWVNINMLRLLGCKLPIELWYLGPNELDDHMRSLFDGLDVNCIDGLLVKKKFPSRILRGWELKPYSILHSSFKEVLFLDADNVPVIDPTYLFDSIGYQENGAIFWPDFGKFDSSKKIWKICGVKFRDEPEFESGQILINKEKCWIPLNLSMWYNEYSDFYYNYIHGDKDTFHMAFRRLDYNYSMPEKPIHSLENVVMCQHDLDGNRVFQHRNLAKWQLDKPNKRIKDFWLEDRCIEFLVELRKKWNGEINPSNSNSIQVNFNKLSLKHNYNGNTSI